jgi:hypothetical protein
LNYFSTNWQSAADHRSAISAAIAIADRAPKTKPLRLQCAASGLPESVNAADRYLDSRTRNHDG